MWNWCGGKRWSGCKRIFYLAEIKDDSLAAYFHIVKKFAFLAHFATDMAESPYRREVDSSFRVRQRSRRSSLGFPGRRHQPFRSEVEAAG